MCLVLQRACYLSINPQKDETLETEKAQYYLPDGSTIEVGNRTSPHSALRPPKALGPNRAPCGEAGVRGTSPFSAPAWSIGALEQHHLLPSVPGTLLLLCGEEGAPEAHSLVRIGLGKGVISAVLNHLSTVQAELPLPRPPLIGRSLHE